jgi:hypothetical protein
MIRRSAPLVACVLLGCIGHQALAPQALAQDASPERLRFAVYAAGLNVLDIVSDVTLGPQNYRIDLNFHTAGMFGALFHSDINSFVQGVWNGAMPQPIRFASWGMVRGEPRETIIDYHADQPVLTKLEPLHEQDRDPVPSAMQRNTVDTLSAMAMLVRAVATTGKCEGELTTFDGRRVLRITAHTAGLETLQSEGRSSFSGPALRCDFDGLQTAGFQHDESEAELHRIHRSTAWLAKVSPEQPALPVRVMFETSYFGHAIAYLTTATPKPPGALASGALASGALASGAAK